MSGGFIILIRLVNETNFFIVFIALIVIFFLLGIILGNLFGRSAKEPKDNKSKKNSVKGAVDQQQKTDDQGQDNQENANTQEANPSQKPKDPRYRYYNWW